MTCLNFNEISFGQANCHQDQTILTYTTQGRVAIDIIGEVTIPDGEIGLIGLSNRIWPEDR
jgi:hypothetical protein